MCYDCYRYWQLPLDKVANGKEAWDRGVHSASETYKHRMVSGCDIFNTVHVYACICYLNVNRRTLTA